MATRIRFTCSSCGSAFDAPLKRNFLGFPKARCTNCDTENLQHLTSGYRLIYTLACIVFGVIFIVMLTHGEVAPPGLLVIGGIIALVKDHNLRERSGGSKRR